MDCPALLRKIDDHGEPMQPLTKGSMDSAPCVQRVKRFFVPDYDPLDPQELPEDWVLIRHDSGIMIYLHQPTRIATLSRPFQLTSGSIRQQRIPRFALPCYDYRKRHPTLESSPNPSLGAERRYSTSPQTGPVSEPCLVSDKPTSSPMLEVCPPLDDTSDDEESCDNTEAETSTEKEEGELSSADDGEEVDGADEDLTEDTEIDGGSCAEPPAKRNRLIFDSLPVAIGATTNFVAQNAAISITPTLKETPAANMPNAVLLTSEEIREYVSRLFCVQEEEALVFRSRCERIRYYRMKRESKKAAACEMRGSPVHQKTMERVRALFDKSPVCVLHEYCQNILHQQVTFKPIVLVGDTSPFRFAAVVNGVTYEAGAGTNKKAARSEAAKTALCEILPEYKEMLEESRSAEQEGLTSSMSAAALPTDSELSAFRQVALRDRSVYEQTSTSRLSCLSPYSIFSEYVKRHCIPEREVKATMVPLGRNRHRFELSLGDLNAKVLCRNKRIGRHHAAQELLAMLHPQLSTWADLLTLYGPHSKPDKKCDSGAILDAQTKGPHSVKTSLIRLLRAKMLELSDQWEAKENGSQKGKFNVPPYSLPVVHAHPDANSTLYSSTIDLRVDAPENPQSQN